MESRPKRFAKIAGLGCSCFQGGRAMAQADHEAVAKPWRMPPVERPKDQASVRPLRHCRNLSFARSLGTVYGMIDAFKNRGCRRSGQGVRVGRWDLPSLDQVLPPG